VTIEDEVFVGHGVMFINDRRPRATNKAGDLQADDGWKLVSTTVGRGAAIGSGAVILGGAHIGRHALVGAGAVVTRAVASETVVTGVPARGRAAARQRRQRAR
jgi:acetyltransferase-like isoleucine patch superfamily enzyme